MTRIFYTDGAPEPEQPPEHHDPPLGFDNIYIVKEREIDNIEVVNCDCGWTLDEWEPCEEHKDDNR